MAIESSSFLRPERHIQVSYFISVLCRSNDRLKVETIAEFLEDGVFFEQEPTLQVSVGNVTKGVFELIEIRYHKSKRPILLSVDRDVTEELEELADVARESGSPKQLLKRIAETKQIFAVEIDQPNLTEEAWAFCDCLEAYVASLLDGIVYAQDDGFYDKKLKLIQRVSS